MVLKKTELKIRGLTSQEVDYLKALAKETKTKSFNEFLLAMCREKIEKGQYNLVESNYLAHLENMKLTSDHVLAQLQRIVENDGLDLYDNKFAATLADIKEQQAQILDQLLKNEIKLLAYHAKQDIVEELTTDWLQFMDDIDALAAERRSGGRS